MHVLCCWLAGALAGVMERMRCCRWPCGWGVCARLEEYLVPNGGLVWVQVSGGGDGWVCSGRGSWHPLVLVALEGLCVRVRIDRTPGADVVVALRVLGV